MYRMLFEKKGNSVWISHLDLMRMFQRAFVRAGFPLTHTQGFNPRPSVSIALPLSVGVESSCELLDFDLDGCSCDCNEIRDRLNATLVEGIRILDVYQNARKLKDLAYLRCKVVLEYDNPIQDDVPQQILNLFLSDSLTVAKKGKNGIVDQDIIPMIKEIKLVGTSEAEVVLESVVSCQNPSLNPMQLIAAVENYLPQLKPDYSYCTRCEIYDMNFKVFR